MSTRFVHLGTPMVIVNIDHLIFVENGYPDHAIVHMRDQKQLHLRDITVSAFIKVLAEAEGHTRPQWGEKPE